MNDLTFQHVTASDAESVRMTLLAIYAEVYRDRLKEAFRTLAKFDERLSHYVAAPHWECVLGSVGDDTVGYAFGYTLQPGARWWSGLRTHVDLIDIEETGTRTFALNELMVRKPWRGTDIARRIHDELMAGRSEERATLLVDSTHPRVRARYESWGYQFLAELRPDLPDALVFDAMLLPLRVPSA